MTLTLTHARTLLQADKRLDRQRSWTPVRDNLLEVVFPVSVAQAMPMSLRFRVCVRRYVEGQAVFQLEFSPPKERFFPLWRFEWRPSGVHTNPNFGPSELRNLRLRGSHIHCCLFGAIEREDRLRPSGARGPRLARPVNLDPSSFANALALACDELRILNPACVPEARWQGSLFERSGHDDD